MGETRYPLGEEDSVRFGYEDYRYSCLCTFPLNYRDHEIGTGEVESMALIGAALVMHNNGGLIKNEYDYEYDGRHEYVVPDCIPEWVRNGIRKAVGDYPERFDCNEIDDFDDTEFVINRLKEIIAWANEEIKMIVNDKES